MCQIWSDSWFWCWWEIRLLKQLEMCLIAVQWNDMDLFASECFSIHIRILIDQSGSQCYQLAAITRIFQRKPCVDSPVAWQQSIYYFGWTVGGILKRARFGSKYPGLGAQSHCSSLAAWRRGRVKDSAVFNVTTRLLLLLYKLYTLDLEVKGGDYSN